MLALWLPMRLPQCNSATVLRVASALQGREKGELGESARGGARVEAAGDLQVQGQWHRVAHSTSWKCHTI